MASQNVSFDPALLTQEEANMLLDKIKQNSVECQDSACRNWAKNALKNGYPQMKIGVGIAAKFGNPNRPFNPACILYSITNNFKLYKQNNIRLSHICHNKLCLNIDHLVMEELSTNIQRNCCYGNGDCSGHPNKIDCIL